MKRIIYLLPILLFCFTINVKAIDKCTTEEMNRLNELAKNVQFKTDYEIDSDEDRTTAIYSIRVIDGNEDLKISYRENTKDEFKFVSFTDFQNLRFDDGIILEIRIYSYTNNLCTDELLKTEKLELTAYNQYYVQNKDKCQKYPEFKYCKEFMNVDYTQFEKIDKEFNEYITINGGVIDNLIAGNIVYYLVIGLILVIVGVVILLYLKKRKKVLDI